jgi:hypothetical protein
LGLLSGTEKRLDEIVRRILAMEKHAGWFEKRFGSTKAE